MPEESEWVKLFGVNVIVMPQQVVSAYVLIIEIMNFLLYCLTGNMIV